MWAASGLENLFCGRGAAQQTVETRVEDRETQQAWETLVGVAVAPALARGRGRRCGRGGGRHLQRR